MIRPRRLQTCTLAPEGLGRRGLRVPTPVAAPGIWRWSAWCPLVLVLGLSMPASPVQAQSADGLPKIVRANVGFDGLYKAGYWTPVQVTIRGGNTPVTGALDAIVTDGDGAQSRYVADRPVAAVPGQSQVYTLYIRFGRTYGKLTVGFHFPDSRGRVRSVSREFDSNRLGDRNLPDGLDTKDHLYVSLGMGIGTEQAIKAQQRDSQVEVQVARPQDAGGLPSRWYGYEAVDAVIVTASRANFLDQISEAQWSALDEWTRMGGRMVICVGSTAPSAIPPGAPLAALVPGEFSGMRQLRSLGPLEKYSLGVEPLGSARDSQIDVPLLRGVKGHIEVSEGTGAAKIPLVVRTPRGFGEVVFVAVDLDLKPFIGWKDRPQFVRRLLAKPARIEKSDQEDVGTFSRIRHTGYDDLAGQLHAGLDQFEGIRVVSFWLVATLVMAYLLLIGPGDYLFLKKVVGRMEWTWVTFPIIVLLFTVGGYALAYFFKGRELRLNQLDLVDVSLDADQPSAFYRGTTWFNIFSPRMEHYNLAVRPHVQGVEPSDTSNVLLSWFGKPGPALGGMSSATGGSSLFRLPYTVGPRLDSLHDVPIRVWSSKSFAARWSANGVRPLEVDLTLTRDERMEGTIVNRMDLPLRDCLLAYEDDLGSRWAYRLDLLEPGKPLHIDRHFSQRAGQLRTLLQDYKLVKRDPEHRDYIQVATPYDPEATSVDTIIRQMMFHEASGGEEYAELTNRYQNFVDLTSHLSVGRAMLVGSAEESATRLIRDGKTLSSPHSRQWTIFRFVFDFNKQESQP